MVGYDEKTVGNMLPSELLEKFVLETILYEKSLLGPNEGSPYNSAKEINRGIKEEYVKETKLLREEINRRFPVKS